MRVRWSTWDRLALVPLLLLLLLPLLLSLPCARLPKLCWLAKAEVLPPGPPWLPLLMVLLPPIAI